MSRSTSVGRPACLKTAANAGLVRIDVPLAAPTQPLYLVYHHELRKVTRVRAAAAAIEAFIRRQA
jgi:hypothetical protein